MLLLAPLLTFTGIEDGFILANFTGDVVSRVVADKYVG